MPRDTLAWQANPRGVFTVKSAATLLIDDHAPPSDDMWKRVWKAKIHLRAKFLLWRIASNCLPTAVALRRRGLGESDLCRVCGEVPENPGHLFLRCVIARLFWCAAAFNEDWVCDEAATGNEVVKLFLDREEHRSRTREKKDEILTRIGVVVEAIWKWRNESIFNPQNSLTELHCSYWSGHLGETEGSQR